MKKALVSILLIITILCQLYPAAYAYDLTGRQDEDTFLLLKSLGIMQGDDVGNFNPDKTINRAEYTAVILRLLGMEDLVQITSVEQSYSDVSEAHWACKYINLAKEHNLVDGIGDGLFGISDDVKYVDAVKIIVCALGYRKVAESSGGYPTGYLNVAQKIGLLKGIKDSKEFSRASAARLLYNALTVDVVDYMGNVYEGEDVLSIYHRVRVIRGVVTGAPDFYDTRKIENDYIEISGELYKTMNLSCFGLLGADVICYVKTQSDGEESICYIQEDLNDNSIIISAENISDETTLQEIVYFNDNNKRKTIPLDIGIEIYYNGSLVSSANRDDSVLKPAAGSITLRDINDDGKYETIVVYSYEYLVVSHHTEEIVYDKFGNNFDYSKAEILNVAIDGEKLVIDDVKSDLIEFQKGDVLSVAVSYDEKCVSISVNRNKIKGKISAISGNTLDDMECYIIGEDGIEKKYSVAKNYINALNNNHSKSVILKPTYTERIFYLNEYNEICNVENLNNQTDTHYGYLIDASKERALSDNLLLKLLTEDNTISVFKTADYVSFGCMRGDSYSISKAKGDEIFNSLQKFGELEHQIFKYKLDENNDITEIHLASTSYDAHNISLDVNRSNYVFKNGVLEQKYIVNSDTVVFSVPTNGYDEEMMVSGLGSNFFVNDKRYDCSLYDIDGGIVRAAVVYDNITKRYATVERGYESMINYGSSPVLYINSIRNICDSDGETYTNIIGYRNGKEIAISLSNTLTEDISVLSELKPGVAILYDVNSVSRQRALHSSEPEVIVDYEILFDFNKDPEPSALWENTPTKKDNAMLFVTWGELSSATDTYCTVSFFDIVKGNNVYYTSTMNDSTPVMEYDKLEKKFKLINIAGINAGQKAFLRQVYSKTKEIVLY